MAKQKVILPDDRIIELYFARDEQAIDATDTKYGKYLYTIAYNIVHDRLDCEECLNDTYLGTWNRIPPARPSVFHSFLSKIMRNIAVDRFRKNSASKRIPSELVVSLNELDDCIAEPVSEDEEYAISELARILNGFLRNMDEREQYIFICRYYYSDRTSDIATMLGISQNTVLRELSRLRQELKDLLDKEGYNV